jgi:AhpD family alkylhydroperoxidase
MPGVGFKKMERIIEARKRAHAYYTKHSGVYRAFSEMERQTYRDGALPKVQKELIAIGISVAQNCESCMEWHIRQALDGGAASGQIIEAVEVGMEMGGGPATVAARFAMDALEYHSGNHPE